MKNWYKKSESDFIYPDVRRLSGILEDVNNLSRDALLEMQKWLNNGENEITPEEAKKRLNYYMGRLGIE